MRMVEAGHVEHPPVGLLHSEIMRNSGATFNERGHEVIHDHGYMVPLQGHEEIVPRDNFYPDTIRSYMDRHEYDRARQIAPTYFGAWVADGSVYLDLSVWVPELSDALVIAKRNNQLAIWDVARAEEIRL